MLIRPSCYRYPYDRFINIFCGEVKDVYSIRDFDNVKKLPYSKNFDVNDPRVISLLRFKNNISCSFISTARTHFSFFEIEFIKIKIIVHQNKKYIILEKLLNPGKSTLSYQLNKTKKYYLTIILYLKILVFIFISY